MRYTDRLAEAGIEPSVGSRGDSYDNALAESIIGLFKTEVIQRKGPWRHLEAVEFATLTWVDWFNARRLLEPIGYVPPAEYEARYHADLRRSITIDDGVAGGILPSLPRPTIGDPGASCEVELGRVDAEFLVTARFTVGRSPASTSLQPAAREGRRAPA